MTDSQHRKPIYQSYYTKGDYETVMTQLPSIVREAEIKAAIDLEPTIYEKREVMDFIRDFIRKKKRKVYGGTAVNELLIAKDPKDAIYDEYKFSDIEFYSPTPVSDLVELSNNLFQAGYKLVQGKEAQHEETYSIFVNLQLYCDITYVPTRIYNGIKTIDIDGILYTHPHFMVIDYLRMFNDPMNAAWRWEKAFHRFYLLLKHYPLEHFDKEIKISSPPQEIQNYIAIIKNEISVNDKIQKSTLISGFDAYNFFIRFAAKDKNVEQMARTNYNLDKISKLRGNVPFIELVSVNYRDDVEHIFQLLKKNVGDPDKLILNEYFPFFQFQEHSIMIEYDNQPVVRILDADGKCVPNILTKQGYMYVSYQYLLMSMMINKFRAHLDKDKQMYFNYGIAISNLIKVRNIYLEEHKLDVINNSIFGEFKVRCVGSTVSYMRSGILRKLKRIKQGKSAQFTYTPEQFFNMSEESQAKFDPGKYNFKNTSGNKITNPKNLLFQFDSEGNITTDQNPEEAFSDTEEDTDINEEETSSKEE